jgi:uncharacterized membrane protein YbaN (DUF454 family)
MNKSFVLQCASISLLVLAFIMIGLGIKAGILPPTITGIGFIIIAASIHLLKKDGF